MRWFSKLASRKDKAHREKSLSPLSDAQVKRSLAAIYFFNILTLMIFPLVVFTEILRRRLRRRLIATQTPESSFSRTHIQWQRSMHLLLIGVLGGIIIGVLGISIASGGEGLSETSQALAVFIFSWSGRVVAFIFLMMLLAGYVNLMLDKEMALSKEAVRARIAALKKRKQKGKEF